MSIHYQLVNVTKQERVDLRGVGARTKHEIAGSPAAAAVVAWYMVEHARDRISFVGDDIDEKHPGWPLRGVTRDEMERFPDMLGEVVTALVAANVLEERGRASVPEENGVSVVRDLRNIWRTRAAPAGEH